MDFLDQIKALAARVPKQLDLLRTEEATKNALVLPFINALGYNVFDPMEVLPEYTADVGIKKGEKVDYAIMRDGQPVILFECKWAGANLDEVHSSQLYRYFSVTPARVGVLTNGIVYRFFSDLEEPNKMDAKPFLEFGVMDVDEAISNELKKFTKSAFQLDEILDAARELKYTREIKRILTEEFSNPSEDFVRFFGSRVHPGRMTQAVRQEFTQLTKYALREYINERINDRLRSALAKETDRSSDSQNGTEQSLQNELEYDNGATTTEEEMQSYFIVKAVLHDVVDLNRVFMRDVQSYCGILLDNSNRKPICRLRFNRAQKYLGIFNEQRQEERVPIDSLDRIYTYAEQLRSTVRMYLSSEKQVEART